MPRDTERSMGKRDRVGSQKVSYKASGCVGNWSLSPLEGSGNQCRVPSYPRVGIIPLRKGTMGINS